jgi:hypothetical protein
MITPREITVVYHSRKKFYNGKNIYWYEFFGPWCPSIISDRFLNVDYTTYYEFGGSHEEAIKCLTDLGITDIVKGNEL